MIDRLKSVVLVGGGLALGVGGVWITVVHVAFLDQAGRSVGDVVAIAKERGVKGTPLHFAIVRHQPAGSDVAIEFKAKPGLWPSPFSVGDEVEVAYDPAHPDDAKIVSFWTLWFLPAVMVLVGVACLVAGRSTWVNAA